MQDILYDYTIRTRYNEVDQMGYVYHANYVTYCHQARTEFMRNFGICDANIELKGIMMPVISFDIRYKKPVGYDEKITIRTVLETVTKIKLVFKFEIYNENMDLVCYAKSGIVFVDNKTRKPMRAPEWIFNVLQPLEKIAL